MKELPDGLHNEVADGLTMLLALRLPGMPAADTAQAAVTAWSRSLAAGKEWDEAQDIPRIRQAFYLLAAQTTRWPAPRDLLDCLPPRPERLKLEHRHRPTEQEKAAAKAVVAEMKRRLAAAPCFRTDWIHAPRSRPVEECKRIYAERQKGKK